MRQSRLGHCYTHSLVLAVKLGDQIGNVAMNTWEKQDQAIAFAVNDMAAGKFRHGPIINSHPVGNSESKFWEVELAHYGESGRSETTDPPSILLRVNVETGEVSSVDLM
jgi:hypothetical protein